MNTIFDWVLNQFSTQWIAIITACAGFFVWKKDHAKIIVEADCISKPVAGMLLDDGRSIINKEHGMPHISMWLINPSVHDISFFDLRVVLNTGEANYYTSVKFNHFNNLKDTKPEALIPIKNGVISNEIIGITLPTTNYRTVPAHGFLQLDLIFEASGPSDDSMILMKLAQSHSLLSRLQHSRLTPKFLRKMGYTFSETKEVALSFQVKEVEKLKIPN